MLIGTRKGRKSYHFTYYDGCEYVDFRVGSPLPQEGIDRVLEAVKICDEQGDPEAAHSLIDGLLVAIADSHGYEDVVGLFNTIRKWYG
jgi:hypothetical protein